MRAKRAVHKERKRFHYGSSWNHSRPAPGLDPEGPAAEQSGRHGRGEAAAYIGTMATAAARARAHRVVRTD